MYIAVYLKLDTTSGENFRKLDNSSIQTIDIIKDAVSNNIVKYDIKLNLDVSTLDRFKTNEVEFMTIFMGDNIFTDAKDKDKVPINIAKLYVKPIKFKPLTSIKDNRVVVLFECISLTTYALLNDKYFSQELNSPTKAPIEQIVMMSKLNALVDVLDSGSKTTSGSVTGLTQNASESWNGSRIEDGKVVFDSPELSVRASALAISNNIDAGSATLESISGIIGAGNDKSYSKDIAKKMGWSPNEASTRKLQHSDIEKILEAATAKDDNYTSSVLKEGLTLASLTNSQIISGNEKGFKVENDLIKTQETTQQVALKQQLEKDNGVFKSSALSVSFKNAKGKDFLSKVLQKMSEKYDIYESNTNRDIECVSNFIYPQIITPTLNAVELIRYLHQWYPAYRINIPWIIDDAIFYNPYEKNEFLQFGISAVYKEINFINPEVMNHIYITKDSSWNKFTTRLDTGMYYSPKENADIEKTVFLFKDFSGVITTIHYKSEVSINPLVVPDGYGKRDADAHVKVMDLQQRNVVEIESNYDAYEFNQRLKLLRRQHQLKPKKHKILFRNKSFWKIDFGTTFMLPKEGDENSHDCLVPYKIHYSFKNQGNRNFAVETTVLAYQAESLVTN